MTHTIITERNASSQTLNEKMHVGVLELDDGSRIFGYYDFSVSQVKDLVRCYRPTAKLLYVVSYRKRHGERNEQV